MAKKLVGSFEDRFLRKLSEQADARDSGITNASLKSMLGWQEDRFRKTRDNLLSRGIIKPGGGQGGKTILLQPPTDDGHKNRKLKVFISYSHADAALKNSLRSHLKPLEKLDLIESWSDILIKPGEVIDDEIAKQSERADLFLLLIGIDFINSAIAMRRKCPGRLKGIEIKRPA